MIGLIVRKELFAMFNSDLIPAVKVNKDHADYSTYATITQENIDAQLAKVLPPQESKWLSNKATCKAMASNEWA